MIFCERRGELSFIELRGGVGRVEWVGEGGGGSHNGVRNMKMDCIRRV